MKTLLIVGMLLISVPVLAQYGWNFKYASNDTTTHWRHLASGDTIAIASFTFSRDNPADPKTYYIKGFRLWPITNASEWFVDSLQLYMDRGNRVFSADDSLISGGLAITIPDQADSVNSISFNFHGDSLLLIDNRMLFVVAVVHEWHDDNPENLEIDTTAAGPYGKWFSIKVFKEDITVSPVVSNDINHPTVVQFGYQALNMPITVRNNLASTAEDDSAKLNMFYPTYLALNNSAASKAQRIDDLSFYADIFLPVTNDSIVLSLKSVSLQFGFDNRVLEFESVEYGNVWGDDSWFYVDTSVTQVELFDPEHPEYTIFQYDAWFNGSEPVNNIYEVIDSSSVIRLKFNVIGPGVSPIFLQGLDLRDRWGIRYHTYQTLQNHATIEIGATGDRFDAWVKYVLGDYTVSGGDEISTTGVCDGRVTWEDIALFSDYIWLNPGHSSWTKRFDIGSSESVSPSQYSHDDTTNFYDLMVLGTNYQRSYQGVFNQKVTETDRNPVEISPVFEQSSGRLIARIAMKNVNDLYAAHIVMNYDPSGYRYESLELSEWVEKAIKNKILIAPKTLAENGRLDLNFVALDGSLSGEGEFVEIQMSVLSPNVDEPEITDIDLRNSECRSLMTSISHEAEKPIARQYALLTNYPNPFNAETRISYRILENRGGNYQVMLFDIRGNHVVTLSDRYRQPGSYHLEWDGMDQFGEPVSSGVYLLTLTGPHVNKIRKVMLLR